MIVSLRPAGSAAVADLELLARRSAAAGPGCLVRLREQPPGTVLAWVLLPYGVLAGRGVSGSLSGSGDVTVDAAQLAETLAGGAPDEGLVALPPARDEQWRSTVPAGRFVLLDEVPADVVVQLLDAGRRTYDAVRGRPDAQAAGEALLESEVLTVRGAADVAGVPLKLLQALRQLGFLAAEPVRVAVSPGWIRVAATHGAVHLRRGSRLGLA